MAEHDETTTSTPEGGVTTVAGVTSGASSPSAGGAADTDEAASPPDEPPTATGDPVPVTVQLAGEDSSDGDGSTEPESSAESSDGDESTEPETSAESSEDAPTESREGTPPTQPTVEVRIERTFSGEIDAGWLDSSDLDSSDLDSSDLGGDRPRGLARVGAGIGRNVMGPGVGRGLPRPSQAARLAQSRASAEHAIDLPLIESRRPDAAGGGSVDEVVETLEGANTRVRELFEELTRVVGEAREASERSANAVEIVVGLLRSERHTRLVEAAQRVHSENEVAVLTEERDRLRRELADARAGGQATETLTEQIRELNERHTAELLRRQEALEAEHEQLQIQSEDRRRLNEELDVVQGALEEKTRRLAQLESGVSASGELAAKLEALEQERDSLRSERDAAREQQSRMQVEAEATRRATQLNVAEQKRLREELETQRRAFHEAQEEVTRLRERLSGVEAEDAAERSAERDTLLTERDELQAAKARLEADLASDRRALETALVDREFVDAEMAEWRAKAEDEARHRAQLEEEQREWQQTQEQLHQQISELREACAQLEAQRAHAPGGAPDLDDGSLPPALTRGLALPGDEATRDDLVERLLHAKQQIDALLQERAQTRVKLRQLEARIRQD